MKGRKLFLPPPRHAVVTDGTSLQEALSEALQEMPDTGGVEMEA